MKVKNVYTVTGKGSFPIDMLRFDLALPASESDAHKIEHAMIGHALREKTISPWSIALISENKPTIGRWESFGWTVKVGA